MRITKKQAAGQKAHAERVKNALRWTDVVEPDVPPPALYSDGLSTGFMYGGYGLDWRADPACSSSIAHSIGRSDRTTSQDSIYLYSTKLLAWKAARNAAELEFANALAGIDYQIERLEQAGKREGAVAQ